MLKFKEWLVTTIKNDATMQGFLADGNGGYNIYPADIDIQPERFPAITYQDVGVAILSVPRGMHIGLVQLDIYSIKNAIEVENIYERLGVLLNFKDSTTQTVTGTLWWVREDSARDMHTPKRRVWRKSVDLKIWMTNTSGA